jgi:Ca2+-binding RTX toxin-like protein
LDLSATSYIQWEKTIGTENLPFVKTFKDLVGNGTFSEFVWISIDTHGQELYGSLKTGDYILLSVSRSDICNEFFKLASLPFAMPKNESSVQFGDTDTKTFGYSYINFYNDYLIGGKNHDQLFGFLGDDILEGGRGHDEIYGGYGNDLIKGGDGNDSLYGEQGDDILYGNAGDDYIDGGLGSDKMYGASGKDTLVGGQGNDTLIGGNDKDFLIGGSGSDVFKFLDANDSTLTAPDTIKDFSAPQGDKIDLSLIDAKSGSTINDTFVLVSEAPTEEGAASNGVIWFDKGYLYGSTNTDVAPEFRISLYGMRENDIAVNLFVL